MHSGMINKTSPFVDVLDQLTGTYAEFDRGEFHVVVTPFFTVLSAVLDAGSHVLPFKVTRPVAGLLSGGDGSVSAVLIKPGDTAVNLEKSGMFNLQCFGDLAKVTGIL